MTHEIRYTGNSNKDRVLRLALLGAWGNTCYWCGEPLDFANTEIDHVVPRRGDKQKRDNLLNDLLRDSPAEKEKFQIDAASNLAPICSGSGCNREKAETIFTSGRFEAKFLKVRAKAPAVEKSVRSFRSANPLAKAVVAVTTADLKDDRARELLEQHASIIDARIRHLDYIEEYEHFDPFDSEFSQVTLTLNEQGRRAVTVIEELSGRGIDNALLAPISYTKAKIRSEMAVAIEQSFEDRDYMGPEAGSVVGHIAMKADTLRYDRDAGQFELTGAFDAAGAASVWVMGSDGTGMDELQGDAEGAGRFSVGFSFDDSYTEVRIAWSIQSVY